jgi:NAD(P)-dependent dehydrogenase (short-subunit alcohol dehydrogenase family)
MGGRRAGAPGAGGAIAVSGCLDNDPLNVVIAGGGALGAALLEALLQRPNLGQAAVLWRHTRPTVDDDRVTAVPFDATDSATIEAAAQTVAERMERVHLLFNAVGMLHGPGGQPEKRVCDLRAQALLDAFAVNAAPVPLLAQAFGRLLRHREPAVFASLSARVGSIGDNQLGGWYSYRASKAAQNMLLRTLAMEWRISHRNVTVVALHPGTVRSPLSAPFLSNNYRNRVHSPSEAAEHLLAVIKRLEPGDSGSFYDWRGQPVPW